MNKKVSGKARAGQGKGAAANADIKAMLVGNEQIVEEAVVSAGIYWKAFAVLIFSIVVAFFVIELAVLLVLVAILMFVHATMLKRILMFTLTDRRIFVRTGILQVDVIDIRFSKIESVELQRMLPGYLMGYANLVVMGTGNRYIVIPYVSNGVQIRKSYNRLTLEDLGADKDE